MLAHQLLILLPLGTLPPGNVPLGSICSATICTPTAPQLHLASDTKRPWPAAPISRCISTSSVVWNIMCLTTDIRSPALIARSSSELIGPSPEYHARDRFVKRYNEIDGEIQIASASSSSTGYIVTPRSCECKAHQKGIPCWHRAAHRLLLKTAEGVSAGEIASRSPAGS